MIIYRATKDGFLNDAFGRDIETVVLGAYQARTGHRVAKAEVRDAMEPGAGWRPLDRTDRDDLMR
jgi:hypothetical protein